MICPACKKDKKAIKFCNSDRRCKKCLAKKAKKYRKSKLGWLSVVYSSQKTNSKKRGHPMPDYTKDELLVWVNQQPNFKKLWKQYKKSGFTTPMKPSIDRIYDDLPYVFDNMQLMTFDENQKKEWNLHKDGKSLVNKDYVKVKQYSMDGTFLAEYDSMNIAARATGTQQPNIHKVCNGIRNSAGGFLWEYSDGR